MPFQKVSTKLSGGGAALKEEQIELQKKEHEPMSPMRTSNAQKPSPRSSNGKGPRPQQDMGNTNTGSNGWSSGTPPPTTPSGKGTATRRVVPRRLKAGQEAALPTKQTENEREEQQEQQARAAHKERPPEGLARKSAKEGNALNAPKEGKPARASGKSISALGYGPANAANEEHNMGMRPSRVVTRPNGPSIARKNNKFTVGGLEVEAWNEEHWRQLRGHHGVEDSFLENLAFDRELPKISKGAEPLFKSRDEEFIIKALNKEDHESLLQVTRDFVVRSLEGSLICPIYVHFRFAKTNSDTSSMTIDKERAQRLSEFIGWVAMRNLTPDVGTWKGRYDLKGCNDDKTLEHEGVLIKTVPRRFWHFWYGKSCWSEARWIYWHSKQDAKEFRLTLPEAYREEVVRLLEYDVQWLQDQGLMDYSLLVGIQRFRGAGHVDAEMSPTGSTASVTSRMSEISRAEGKPQGRNHIIYRDTILEKTIFIMISSREELERGVMDRILQAMEEEGLNPYEWEFEMEGVNKPVVSTRNFTGVLGSESENMGILSSVVSFQTLRPSPIATFPRKFRVNLLKRVRDRPMALVQICVIDFLQEWNWKKKCANWFKCLEANRATVPPGHYGDRFLSHFKECIRSDKALVPCDETDAPTSPPVVKPYDHRWHNPDYAGSYSI